MSDFRADYFLEPNQFLIAIESHQHKPTGAQRVVIISILRVLKSGAVAPRPWPAHNDLQSLQSLVATADLESNLPRSGREGMD